ncbi:hypothetical protein EXN66_Car015975 [Channa argus]|uniref:Uncharacterized protein n=1 Tax=Channa argus TaxID=215402 RepID=A0A6G1QDF6_CHAAH|nr:hypothetical protein EXN66_Car015975 [Channa argus]
METPLLLFKLWNSLGGNGDDGKRGEKRREAETGGGKLCVTLMSDSSVLLWESVATIMLFLFLHICILCTNG